MTWEGEVCKNCGENSHIGFHVPDDIWAAVTCFGQQGIWCVGCFTREAEARGIPWAEHITFLLASALASEPSTPIPHTCGEMWIEGPLQIVAGEDSFTGTATKPPCDACNTVFLEAVGGEPSTPAPSMETIRDAYEAVTTASPMMLATEFDLLEATVYGAFQELERRRGEPSDRLRELEAALRSLCDRDQLQLKDGSGFVCRRCQVRANHHAQNCPYRVLGETPEARCYGSGITQRKLTTVEADTLEKLLFMAEHERAMTGDDGSRQLDNLNDAIEYLKLAECPGCGACKPVPEERKV